jgi:hypothetical protein
MKKIEWLWNVVYYNLYLLDIKISYLFNFINPIYWLNKIPAVKKYHLKHGVDDMNTLTNRTFNNPKSGLSSIWAGSAMGGLLVLVGYGLFNVVEAITNKPQINTIWKDGLHFSLYFILLLLPVIIINNYLLFRKNKYLNYFKEFEKLTNKQRTTYRWVSLIVVVLILFFFIGSFLIL